MILNVPGSLLEADPPISTPQPGQLLIRVHTYGICQTDLHVVDGELTQPKLPLIPGHQIVGTGVNQGDGVQGAFPPGT